MAEAWKARRDGSEQRSKGPFLWSCEENYCWAKRLLGAEKGRGEKGVHTDVQVRTLTLCLNRQVGILYKFKFIDLYGEVSAGLAKKG